MIIELKTKTGLIPNRRNRMLLTLVSPVSLETTFSHFRRKIELWVIFSIALDASLDIILDILYLYFFLTFSIHFSFVCHYPAVSNNLDFAKSTNPPKSFFFLNLGIWKCIFSMSGLVAIFINLCHYKKIYILVSTVSCCH